MRKLSAIIGSGIFLIIAPGLVAGLLPAWISRWQFETPFLGMYFFRFIGTVLIMLGSAGVLDSFIRFATVGLGTPAPGFGTSHLVVIGLYRYVRNPMYVSLVSIIFGQALLFGNVTLIAYGAVVWLLFHIFVLVYEEPTMRASFGTEYESFCAQVPRWIPNLIASRGLRNPVPAVKEDPTNH